MGGLLAGDGCGVLQGGRLGWEIRTGLRDYEAARCEVALVRREGFFGCVRS